MSDMKRGSNSLRLPGHSLRVITISSGSSFFLFFLLDLMSNLIGSFLHCFDSSHGFIIHIDIEPNILLIFVMMSKLFFFRCIVNNEILSCIFIFQVYSSNKGVVVLYREYIYLHNFFINFSKISYQFILELLFNQIFLVFESWSEKWNIWIALRVVKVQKGSSFTLIQKSCSNFLEVLNCSYRVMEFNETPHFGILDVLFIFYFHMHGNIFNFLKDISHRFQ